MHDAKVRAALLVVCFACLLGSGVVLLRGHSAQQQPIVFVASPTAVVPAAAAAPTRPKRLYVDVAGAVRRPSLYVLPKNSRIMQAILAAGGPTADADIEAVNLAELVTDGEKVFVPKRGMVPVVAVVPSAPTSNVPMTPKAPTLTVSKASRTKGNGGSSRSGKIGADSGEQISLNSATLEELERLPGVGPSMAGRILAYRQQSGGFAKIDELTLVPGIGPKKLAKITPFVTL